MRRRNFDDFKTQAKNKGISGEELSKSEEIIKSIPLLKQLTDDIITIISMIKDYKNGTYREIPLTAIISFAAAFLYLLSPLDAVPDFVPIVGYFDDTSVMIFVLKTFHDEIEKYKEFKSNQI